MTRNSGISLLVGLVLGLSALGQVQADTANGSSKAAQSDQCVRPTAFMRRNHFEVIKHQRDVTVHQGVRNTEDGLAKCVDCHAERDSGGKAIPVNAEGQFCDGCHDYVAVNIDCFSCHTNVPGGK
jgi:predicted CXXCH cytochrome family protein